MTPLRTYPVKLGASDGMPSSLFDPRWKDPAVAARVAFVLYCRSGVDDGTEPLIPPPVAPRPELTDARTFRLEHVHALADGTAGRFKGGSYGELHRHYAFGRYTVNFHAQAVAFGFDDVGRWFVSATVGRFDGPWGNDGALVVRWCAGDEVIGASAWHKELDPTGDARVRLVGRDKRLAARFDDVTHAAVEFTARHGKDVPAKTAEETAAAAKGPARLSRARRSVVGKEVSRALSAGDDATVRKLLAGVHADDIKDMLGELGRAGEVARVLKLLDLPAGTTG